MRIDNKVPGNQAVTGGVPTIHNIHILDASGSMGGGKYTNALKGINSEIMAMKTNGDNMTQTIIEFDSGNHNELKLTTHYFMTPAANCTAITGVGASGGTPLYQTVGETLEKLLAHVKNGDKVLVKIFTDGEENASRGKYARNNRGGSEELTKIIKLVEDHHNFTVTFMGTSQDVNMMINSIGITSDNTLVHMNTPESIGSTYTMSTASTQVYRKAVSRGISQESLKGKFFKRTEKDIEDELKQQQSGQAINQPLNQNTTQK
jgi:hypothetical protein